MNILIINPNTTASMTAKIDAAARTVAHADSTIIAVQPDSGPASIEGYYDEAFALPGLMTEVQKHPHADAIVIACFDDTGLDATRCITDVPVIGIGEAAFHIAALVSAKFGVVTTTSRSIAALEHNVHKYGFSNRCAKVRAADVPVLALEDSASTARDDISAAIRTSVREDGADAIVLGCAGMTDLAQDMQAEHGVPVIDGVVSAVKLAESLVCVGAKTAKTGAYSWPGKKKYRGSMAPYSPHGGAAK